MGVKAFWFELGVTLREQPASRYSILQTVTEKIAEEGKLGQLDDANLPDYVQGTMEMRYGSWEGGRLELVWFLGSDETHLVGLGGRLRHMLRSMKTSCERAARVRCRYPRSTTRQPLPPT